MIYKIFKSVIIIVLVVIILWGFADSYSSHTIDNIVHVVAVGVDKCDDGKNNMKVSFQFVDTSTVGENSSGEGESTIITSINSTTINKAINLMNSYIGKEINFSHCKLIVFSKEFVQDGISTEVSTFINNAEIRPSTNLIISSSDANSYLKQSNPNIEKLVTNYYDTFSLTSNFTGYSENTTIGKFYNELFNYSYSNTAMFGRTFEPNSDSSQGENGESSQNEGDNSSQGESSKSSQNEDGKSSSQNSSENSGKEGENNTSEGLTLEDGSSLEISGKRRTENLGIAVFKEDKYIGELNEIDSICHMLITNSVDSFIISIPMENYSHNLLDLDVSPIRNTKIKVDLSSGNPDITIFVYCEAKILTIDTNSNYNDPNVLSDISNKAKEYLTSHIESYLNKTSKELDCDIADFGKHALSKFLTLTDWKNYEWNSKYKNANFNVNVDMNVTSSLLFLGEE